MADIQDRTLSVVVVVHDPTEGYLARCIESVRNQTYYNWELCIAKSFSASRASMSILTKLRGIDSRIRIVDCEQGLTFCDLHRLAVQQAIGKYLVFLDENHSLAPHALEELNVTVSSKPELQTVYFDEDIVLKDDTKVSTNIKPCWSPEHLESCMYIGNALAVRKQLYWDLSGMRSELEPAQIYDFILRAVASGVRPYHLPKTLYHSTSEPIPNNEWFLAGKMALQEYLHQSKVEATIEPGKISDSFRIRRKLSAGAEVTLLFLTADVKRVLENGKETVLVQQALRSIAERSTYKHYRILLIHNDEISVETKKLVKNLGGLEFSVGKEGRPFSYPEWLNYGFSKVQTEHVIVLNDDIEVASKDWIESLLEWSQIPDVGAVGARLLYPDRSIQHAGIGLLPRMGATHLFYKQSELSCGYNGSPLIVRNYSAVTAAAVATRMEVVKKVGGFDPLFRIDYNDVDFCLRVQKAGYRIVYTPYCELIHHESSSVKRTTQNPLEVEEFYRRWNELAKADPYFDYCAVYRADPDAVDPSRAMPLENVC